MKSLCFTFFLIFYFISHGQNLHKNNQISYPGYKEMFAGFADPRPNLNPPVYIRHLNVLEYINNSAEHHGKAAVFSSWNLFPFILSGHQNDFVINGGFEKMGDRGDTFFDRLNLTQNSSNGNGHTSYDHLTILFAMEYTKKDEPDLTFIDQGETDEFAHGQLL